ncbi:hypothetical protein EDB87DRAFT_1683518 [Lactarius vividus]|nr:hypothetical protein EDB87DRAFT_1683518 [Lactarius vividus]
MMREELDQEQELDDNDSDSDIDDEDSIIAQIQGLLDKNDDILRAKDRKQRNRIFRGARNGNFIRPRRLYRQFAEYVPFAFANSNPSRSSLCIYVRPVCRTELKRDKHVPAELHDQWECDRKKAERKRLRELERTAAALNLFTLTKRGGKKERKKVARKAAAASISLETVVGNMRRFVEDFESAPTLSLPPMERHARKSVYEVANAFNLNSKSEGNGEARFTRLVKTTRSGLRIGERKVARILGKPAPPHGGDKGKGKGKAGGEIRPRDGEFVGGAAPKIDGSSLGYGMGRGQSDWYRWWWLD